MKYTLLLYSFLFSTLVLAQETQEKYQRAKITYSQQTNGLTQLEALGIPVEHGIHKNNHFIISEFLIF